MNLFLLKQQNTQAKHSYRQNGRTIQAESCVKKFSLLKKTTTYKYPNGMEERDRVKERQGETNGHRQTDRQIRRTVPSK